MKKIICLFCLVLAGLLLLSGCTGADNPEPSTAPTTAAPEISAPALALTADTFPVLDGSTANIPLAKGLVKLCLGLDDAAAEPLVQFNTTPKAYENLANGDCDLLLVYEASQETKDLLDDMDADLEYFPIGLDALVFIANENNPVTSLTQAQLVDIYTGKIKRWKEVGGEDIDIVAFQRDATSGSQALMKKLVMQDTPMMDAPTELVPMEMGDLIDRLAEYDNSSGALGYSVYYYASLMYTRTGLKFMGVDGVMPSNESIAAEKYPYTNAFYAVVRADEPEDSPARALAQWLGTSDGKALITQCGYVAAP